MDNTKVKSFSAFVPELDDLKSTLEDGLKSYFSQVQIDVVDCPDFTQAPYKTAVKGLGGKTTIADVGGVHNLTPHVNLSSKFDMGSLASAIYNSGSDYPISVLGVGGGPFYKYGFNSEFVGSAKYERADNGISMTGCSCRYCFVDGEGKGSLGEQSDDYFGLMGNFFLSQGKPGKVIKVHVKRRLRDENYTESIRAVLKAKYGPEKPVSMGGIFLINAGVAKLHIMPKHWPEEPSTYESIDNWLNYYSITKHPLVCVSAFHSHDPGYDLRMEHTHCFNLDTKDEGGHYHYDTTPETVEYEGYFQLAERVYRLWW